MSFAYDKWCCLCHKMLAYPKSVWWSIILNFTRCLPDLINGTFSQSLLTATGKKTSTYICIYFFCFLFSSCLLNIFHSKQQLIMDKYTHRRPDVCFVMRNERKNKWFQFVSDSKFCRNHGNSFDSIYFALN